MHFKEVVRLSLTVDVLSTELKCIRMFFIFFLYIHQCRGIQELSLSS